MDSELWHSPLELALLPPELMLPELELLELALGDSSVEPPQLESVIVNRARTVAVK